MLLGSNGILLYGVLKQVVYGEQFGDNPMSNGQLLFAAGEILLVTLLFLSFTLETTIKQDGIYVRFFPFHLKAKRYSWDTLIKSFVRKYSPLKEYGGWGLRLGIFGKGVAFNISGNKGLQLEFTNNNRLLIGTKRPEDITRVLKEIRQLKE